MNIIDKIISNFINNKSLYIGEKVTISEHMIQTAMIAENMIIAIVVNNPTEGIPVLAFSSALTSNVVDTSSPS